MGVGVHYSFGGVNKMKKAEVQVMLSWVRFGLLMLIVWVLINSFCHAEIVGPEKVEEGQLIDLTVTDVADIFIWQLSEGLDSRFFDGNKRVVASGKKGTYRFTLTCAKVNWEAKTVEQLPTLVKVVTVGAKPDDPDDPDNPPIPVPDLTGFAKEVYGWAMQSSNRGDAVALSANYANVAKQYNDNMLTVEQAMDLLRKTNNEILNTREKKDAWAVFGSRLEERLSSGWPMDKDKLVAFLNDVAKGLSYVK